MMKEIISLFNLQSRQVKCTPQDSINESIDYLKDESDEYFTRNSLYLVRLKIFEWIKQKTFTSNSGKLSW